MLHQPTARTLGRFICRTSYIKPIKVTSPKWNKIPISYRYFCQLSQQSVSPKPSPHNNGQAGFSSLNLIFPIVGVALGTLTIGAVYFKSYYKEQLDSSMETEHTIMNYSGTHSATPTQYFQPNSVKEVENLVQYCHKHKISFRPMGTGISPNGISFSDTAVMDMSHCNKILNIDREKKQITVEAGIKVKDIIDAIVPFDMALENIPSITEQQIGGLIQVSAHGTGINIGPCDVQIVKMSIVTPECGKIELTAEDELFKWARVGLGTFGVVTEVTVQCVDRHKLSEYLWVMSAAQIMQRRDELLHGYKHVKLLWIPYMDKAVVCASNPIDDPHLEAVFNASHNDTDFEVQCQQPLRQLLSAKTGLNIEELSEYLSFADLRDLLLGSDGGKHVLDTEWIKQINRAELEYWNNVSSEYGSDTIEQIDFSENVLSFKCGGQQWVYEICFPIQKYYGKTGQTPLDIQFAQDMLFKIESNDIPAPSPLEHRWTAPSNSYLSPAYSDGTGENESFCWFGIIFYIPTGDEQKRRWISNEFQTYSRILDELCDEYGAIGHWAKVETHYLNKKDRLKMQNRIRNRFGERKLNEYFEIRNKYDPNGILINDVVSDLFNI